MTEPENPFQGLGYFTENDAARFAGRERDIQAVASGILRSRTFVLYGRSGLGKTSLMLAGVFPHLSRQGCVPIYIRVLEDPLGDLRHALAEHAGGAAGSEPDLAALVELAGGGRLVVVLFDQFEEFFVRFADHPAESMVREETPGRAPRERRAAQSAAFIAELGRLAAAAELNLRLVFSLREDWFAGMDDFAAAIPEITRETYRLLPLSAFGVRQSILEMLRFAGVGLDSRLVSALVETLAEVNFDPAVLQVICREVWRRARQRAAPGELRLELDDLVAVGDVKAVFQGYLDRLAFELQSAGPRRSVLARAVLEALISERSTKLALTREGLLRQWFQIGEEELDTILELLHRHQLLRRDPRGGIGWLELVHERMIPVLRPWLDADPAFGELRAARNLVVNAYRNSGWRGKPELLLNQGQLDETVGPLKELIRFSAEERLFLVSSAIHSHSAELEYWTRLAGGELSGEVVERFLTHPDERVRQNAAEAARRVVGDCEHLARLCLELALADRSAAVRGAAARSFAALASPAEFRLLAQQLEGGAGRPAALDVLTELVDQGNPPPAAGIDRGLLAKARHRAYLRRLEKELPALRAREQRGALIGALAGFVWMATGGALLLRLLLYESVEFVALGVGKEPWGWPLATVAGCAAGAACGALIGWLAAGRAGREALRSGREGAVFRSMVGRKTPLVLGAAAAFFGFSALMFVLSGSILGTDSVTVQLASLALALLGFGAFSALVARLARPSYWPAGRGFDAWFWAWPWALAGSTLVPNVLVWWLEDLDSLIPPLAGSVAGLLGKLLITSGLMALVLVAIFGGFFIYVGQLAVALAPAVARSGFSRRPAAGEAAPPPKTRRLHRGFGLALAAATLWFWLAKGSWDALPGMAARQDIAGGSTVLAPDFADAPVDMVHLRLQTPAPAGAGPPAPRLLQLRFDTTALTVYTPGSGDVNAVLAGQSNRSALGFEVGKNDAVLSLEDGQSLRLAIFAKLPARLEARRKELQLQLDQPLAADFPLTENAPWRPLVMKLAKTPTGWSAPLPRLGPAGRAVAIEIGQTAQSGSWCRDVNFDLALVEAGAPRQGFSPLLTCRANSGMVDFPETNRLFLFTDAPAELTIQSRGSRNALAYDGDLSRATLSPDGEKVGALSEEGKALLFDSDRSLQPRALPHDGRIYELSFSPDGSQVATASADKTARIWNAEKSGDPLVLKHGDYVRTVKFSNDGSRVVTASDDGTARIWDARNGQELRQLPVGGSWVVSAAFSPDGHQVLTLSKDKTVLIWPAAGAGPKIALRHPVEVSYAAFDPSGALVLTVATDHVARIWDLGRPVHPIFERPTVAIAEFSPDGNRVLSVSSDGKIHLWAPDGSGDRAIGRQARALWAGFTPDGRIASVLPDNSMHIEAPDRPGDPIVLRHDKPLVNLDFARDGGRLTTTTNDGKVHIWSLEPAIAADEDLFLFLRLKLLTDEELSQQSEAPPAAPLQGALR